MSDLPAWIDITAVSAVRSRAFYQDLLGWEIHVVESMNYGLVQPGPGRLPGGIGQADDDGPHRAGLVVYFSVTDLDATLRLAGSLGAATLVPTWELPNLGRWAIVADPDGNPVGLWQSPRD